MVDKNDVYLNIKINYRDKIKEIKSKEFLKISEIKSKIKELFSLKNDCNEDLELYTTKNNQKISNDNDILYLIEEENEYLYVLEINLKNNKINIEEELNAEIKEIKKGKEKIKELKNEIHKYRILIQYNKKKKELKRQIHTIKIINEVKEKLINKILSEVRKEINNNFNIRNENIKNRNEEIKKNYIQIVNSKMEDIKTELKEKVIKEIEQIKKNLDSIDKKIK